MKEVNPTVLGKGVTQILNIGLRSPYNKDIDTELRPDRQAANIVGQEQFPDQSGINRFLRRFTPLQVEDLTLIHGLTLREYWEVHQAEVVVIDLDKVGRTIRIKLLVAHVDAPALVAALASINAQKLGRQLGLPLIWGPGFRSVKPTLHMMDLGP